MKKFRCKWDDDLYIEVKPAITANGTKRPHTHTHAEIVLPIVSEEGNTIHLTKYDALRLIKRLEKVIGK